MKQRFNAVALNRDPGDFRSMSMDRRTSIRQFMERNRLKTAPWAREAKVPEGTLRDYLSGRNNTMTLETLDKLAQAASATVADMIGEKLMAPKPGRDIAAIKSLQLRASMGGGFEVVDEPEGPPFYFRRQWIEKILGGQHGQLRVLQLEGDSMLPTINDGDMGLVLLPGEETKFQSGAIYALWDGTGLIVKRVESRVGDRPRLRIISDNKAIYEPYEVDAEEVRIIAQLMWRGGAV